MQDKDLDTFQVLNSIYDESSKNLLLEQYKIYVEMHDRISERRNKMNNFYTSLLSGLLGLLSFLTNQDLVSKTHIKGISFLGIIMGILGLSLCLLWAYTIRVYARLIDRKLTVIREIEKYLPFYCYIKEGHLRELERVKQHPIFSLRVSTIEQLSTFIFSSLYIILVFYSAISFLN